MNMYGMKEREKKDSYGGGGAGDVLEKIWWGEGT